MRVFALKYCRKDRAASAAPDLEVMAQTDSISYWIVVEGKNFKTGKPVESKRFGPYSSEQEAELAEPDILPWDDQDRDYVYRVHIEAIEQGGR